jgi:hypothetical protein
MTINYKLYIGVLWKYIICPIVKKLPERLHFVYMGYGAINHFLAILVCKTYKTLQERGHNLGYYSFPF